MEKPVLTELFKTEERIRILRHVAGRSPVTATAVAGATGTSKPLVSRYLRLLVQSGFCKQNGREYSRNGPGG
jgi:DNA-binding IclR family transcriptional regulator